MTKSNNPHQTSEEHGDIVYPNRAFLDLPNPCYKQQTMFAIATIHRHFQRRYALELIDRKNSLHLIPILHADPIPQLAIDGLLPNRSGHDGTSGGIVGHRFKEVGTGCLVEGGILKT